MKVEICDEQVDRIIVDFLKQHIGYCEKPDSLFYETNDNKSHLLSALYRTLEFCTTRVEYQGFVEDMKNARNSYRL